MPASSYQPFAFATKKPVWSVLGVQSRARRTVVFVTAADGAEDDGATDGGAESGADASALGGGVGVGPPLPTHPATMDAAAMIATRALKVFTLTRIPCCVPENAKRRPGFRAASSRRACFLRWYEPDQVPRVCGLATLSALTRSPEANLQLRRL